ncbi:MAG: Brp/Blh family beta-carotene 15,15'-monooxygenase [Reinekea sp.]|jgi:Brp/Blh family beta-carotene 15,15'-monooxygenase
MNLRSAWQTWIFACAAIITIAVNFVLQPDLQMQLLMLVPAVVVLGLPHGALDLSIAQILWPLEGWRGMARFVCLYIGLALLVIGIWIVFPGPALIIFLIYSGFHFSGDWDDAGIALRCTGGFATIGAPALFHQEDVAAIFSYLAPDSAATLAAMLLATSGGITLFLFAIINIWHPKLRSKVALEQAIIWVAAAFLAPLVYFVVYFCMLHSVRHFTDALACLDDRLSALRVAGLLSAITVFVGLLSFFLQQKSGTYIFEQSILQIIFIGLAALTVPHMLLVDRFQKQLGYTQLGDPK